MIASVAVCVFWVALVVVIVALRREQSRQETADADYREGVESWDSVRRTLGRRP